MAIELLLLGVLIAFAYVRRAASPRIFWIQAVLVSQIFLATFIARYNDTILIAELLIIIVIGETRGRRWLSTLWRQSMARVQTARTRRAGKSR